MPKVSKNKVSNRKFSLKWVTDHLSKWLQAANQLETTARREFRAIRGYIPRFEQQMTTSEREALLNISSKFLKFKIIDFSKFK